MLEELHPDFMDIQGTRNVEQQIDIIDKHIAETVSRLKEEKKRLIKAQTSDEALIGYFYEKVYPAAVFVGDEVGTKYGESGEVINIDKEKGKLTFKTEEGEEKTYGVDRLSWVDY